jgi:hypothetical protein
MGEGQPPVGRKERTIELYPPGVAQQRTQPGIGRVRRGFRIPMGKMEPTILVRDVEGLGHESNAELPGKIVPMPGVVIPKEVRHGDPPIRPPGQECLKPNEALGNQVTVFDVSVKHIPQKIEVTDLIGMGI